MSCGKYVIIMVTAFFFISSSSGQAISPTRQSDSLWRLTGDTLYYGSGQKVYVGENLLVGKATGANGWFHTVGFKSDFSWPIWFMRDTESKYNYEYQTDPQKRVNDKVSAYLRESDTLIIKKLMKEGNRRSGYWVTAILTSSKFPKIKYRSNIMQSLNLKELLAL